MSQEVPAQTVLAVPFRQALRFWLHLGFISFGGPAGQIAIMHRELVERRGWISEKRFLHALNFCMLLPGPEAQQLATYLGWLMHKTRGGIAAGVLFVLPSLLMLIALSWLYMVYGTQPLAAGVLYGIKPAVVAIVMHALHRLASKTLGDPRCLPVPWAIAFSSFVALSFFAVPFPAVVLAALLVGVLLARWAPGAMAGAVKQTPRQADGQAAGMMLEASPLPEHARFKRSRLAWVLLAGALLWSMPMAALLWWQGWSGTLTQMGWFFSKAAMLTFGGAYAVLPYVNQAAVEQYQWLSTGQMMDGLALGESTPGPLIMVVAYVAFVGGWLKQVAGPDALFQGAALAACVATWFTFLPSFIFILAGGPWVESTRGNVRLTIPLAAVTAAVVGVIANLALYLGLAVAYPATRAGAHPLWSLQVDAWALLLVLAAALALWRLKWSVLQVIGACALAGLALRWLGLA